MKPESIVSIGGIALVVAAALTFQKPDASASPVVVGSPPGVEAQLRTELNAALTANEQLKKQVESFNSEVTRLRASIDARDKALVQTSKASPVSKPAVTETVRQAAPPAVQRLPAGGAWVDRPTYGPLGRQRGTQRVWVPANRASNCANGVCR